MTWIQTASRGKFDFINLKSNEIKLEDLAHSGSNICRFNGAIRRFYSVIEHEIFVVRILYKLFDYISSNKFKSEILEDNISRFRTLDGIYENVVAMLYGLLHDGSERYMCDLPRPLKNLPIMAGYLELEHQVQNEIYLQLLFHEPYKLGLDPSYLKIIKLADDIALNIEADDLLNPLEDWNRCDTSALDAMGLTEDDFKEYYNFNNTPHLYPYIYKFIYNELFDIALALKANMEGLKALIIQDDRNIDQLRLNIDKQLRNALLI